MESRRGYSLTMFAGIAAIFGTLPLILGAGALIGLVLGAIGAGGSILATPLLVYVVGVGSPHEAIGVGAVAVAAAALANLAFKTRGGAVRWPCGLAFAGAGVIGALIGAQAGKAIDGQKLLALFGALMIMVGVLMARRRGAGGDPTVRLTRASAPTLAPRLAALGFAVGLLSGFFGIGGGFLIVPALMAAASLPIEMAVATSLVAVAAFGASTAASYAAAGLVDWRLAAVFVLGGLFGALPGDVIGRVLANRKPLLNGIFAAIVTLIGAFIVWRGWTALIT